MLKEFERILEENSFVGHTMARFNDSWDWETQDQISIYNEGGETVAYFKLRPYNGGFEWEVSYSHGDSKIIELFEEWWNS
jgi:hypothetical protein